MAVDAEVVVVGAGPGGCATALHLARRGHDVLVVDRAAFPREKVCGEGLMPHGVAALQRLGLGEAVRAFSPPRFTGIAYHAGGHTAVGRFPGGRTGLGVRRLHLDAALVRACEDEPRIELRTGVRVRTLDGGPGRVRLGTNRGELRARAVVGADGLNSTVRRLAGLDRPAGGRRRYGIRGHFSLRPEHVDRDVVDVYVGTGGGEGTEFYLTPTGPGEINVAVLCGQDTTRTLKGDLARGFDRVARAFGPVRDLLRGAEPLSDPSVTGPLRRETTDVVADSLLLVGDAAGFVDAITGEGISLTLRSAELAAETLHSALRRGRLSRRDLRGYATRRRAANRDLLWLTEIVLWGIRHRWLASRVVGNLARRPELFGRVLAINSGELPLTGIGLRGALGLVR